jgi:signal transduction histidine kinase
LELSVKSSLVSRRKRKDKPSRYDLETLERSSMVLRSHLAMIRSERQMLELHHLTNAIKFTPISERIQILVKPCARHVLVVVKDNGQGIPPAFLPHIFEYFQQANMSSNRSAGGLGLGLAISHRLIEMHGGILQAKSPGVGLGATFELCLPYRAKDDSDTSDGAKVA